MLGCITAVKNTDAAIDNTEARQQVYKDFYSEKIEYIYTTANVNVRKEPSLKADIIKTVPKGTEVNKIGEIKDWFIILFKNKEYYMHSDYLSKSRPKEEKICLGKWKITAYCNCEECCGKWAYGFTSSGTMPEEGRTVACNSLPAGTDIIIGSHRYTVEDTGYLLEEQIDIYFENHNVTDAFGVKYKKVYLIKK